MLAHNSLASLLRLKFILGIETNLDNNIIDEMKPWELQAYVKMLEQHLKDKESKSGK